MSQKTLLTRGASDAVAMVTHVVVTQEPAICPHQVGRLCVATCARVYEYLEIPESEVSSGIFGCCRVFQDKLACLFSCDDAASLQRLSAEPERKAEVAFFARSRLILAEQCVGY